MVPFLRRPPDHQFFWDYVPAAAGRSLGKVRPGADCTLRWIYLPMIEDYARHNPTARSSAA